MSYAALFDHQQVCRNHTPRRKLRFKSVHKCIVLAMAGCALATVTVMAVDMIGLDNLLYTAEERAEMQAVRQMLNHVNVVKVACPGPQIDQAAWNSYTDKMGWPAYLPGGAGCVQPTSDVQFNNVSVFQVACPTIAFDAADQQRWVKLADRHGWTPYPQAGAGCVDP